MICLLVLILTFLSGSSVWKTQQAANVHRTSISLVYSSYAMYSSDRQSLVARWWCFRSLQHDFKCQDVLQIMRRSQKHEFIISMYTWRYQKRTPSNALCIFSGPSIYFDFLGNFILQLWLVSKSTRILIFRLKYSCLQ